MDSMIFSNSEEQAIESASKVRLLLLDVDGILTDGRLYFSNSGEESKAFHSLDGHGIKMLMLAGIPVGIITGRESNIVTKRAADLGIDILYQGREDKIDVLKEIIATKGIEAEAIAYAGDDLPDLPVLQAVGLSFSVPGAHPDVKGAVNAITTRCGGEGAVREITDFILNAQANH
ncbi:MAG: 3-deoxy-D-manno-octulosonate 8-phosphate phosphatase (KDO 8-P phosphatase) [Kiritimatiellia bacterium]|jgi:3-deoxy-D-manno-octulosonate 8-phosphate phosphatase (KDO 8-P phosphatase)